MLIKKALVCCLLVLGFSCRGVLNEERNSNSGLGQYKYYYSNSTEAPFFANLFLAQTDLTPAHPAFQSYANLVSSYNFAKDPLFVDAGGGNYNARPADTLTRSEFFVLLKKLILENVRIEYQKGTARIFPCKNSANLNITGATVSDFTSADSAFQSVQCLVDNNLGAVIGVIDSGLVRPNVNLKRGELYAITNAILEGIHTPMQQIHTNYSNRGVCVVKRTLKSFFNMFIAQISVFPNASAQVTSILQFSDIPLASPYYSSVSNLIEKYGVIDGYPFSDGTIHVEDDATYADIVMLWNSSLDKMKEIGDSITADCL